jgi:predicted nucleotidyltransferase
MHTSGTNNFKFDQRSIRRLEDSIKAAKEMFKEDLLEISVFGSYAKGRHKKFSSIDLLVIVAESGERFIRRNAQLNRAINEDTKIPLAEPLVYTEEELLDLVKKKESFIISALKESVVIWNNLSKVNLGRITNENSMPSRYKATVPHLHEIKH